LYKYARIEPLARPLGDLLMAALPRDERFDAVAPVPLHWLRQWRRGFNQSELLAREIARRSGLPLLRALRRVRSTPAQAGLSNTARRQNVAAAFQCSRSAKPAEGRRILLVDDVMTTGATASACALALKRGGASRVGILTVARADRRTPASRPAAATMSAHGGD
jgi:ComF family protein